MNIGIIGAGKISAEPLRLRSRERALPPPSPTVEVLRSLEDLRQASFSTIKGGHARRSRKEPTSYLIAANWSKLPAAVAGLPAWNGRIVIDANNPVEAPLFNPVDFAGSGVKPSRSLNW